MKRSLVYFAAALCAIGLAHADQTTRSLQQALKRQGFYYGTVTGEKSAETTTAIRRYQIRNGLKVTGEINEETTQSLKSISNSVAAVAQRSSKPAAPQLTSVPVDVSATVKQASPPPSFSHNARQLASNPSYSATFYQSSSPRVNRRTIAVAQYQLMRRGYYRGRVDGNYGSQTASALRAFQSNAGLVPTGRLDMQTLDAIGSSDMGLAYGAPASRLDETWVPMRKFKHGKWKLQWRKYQRELADEPGDQDRQPNTVYEWQDY